MGSCHHLTVFFPASQLNPDWQPEPDLETLKLRLGAYALLQAHYSSTGGVEACGPLAHSPDSDLLILGACSQVCTSLPLLQYLEVFNAIELSCDHASLALQGAQTAMLFYASYKCSKQLCSGAPCVYGVKLLGTAKALAGTDPRAGQVDQVNEQPSTGPVARSAIELVKGRRGTCASAARLPQRALQLLASLAPALQTETYFPPMCV